MRRGFTLIELLVSLAIVGALAALLLPVLARARRQAARTVCLANERQLGMAFALYAQDSDGRLPDFHSDPQSAAAAADVPLWHDRFCQCLAPTPGQVCFASLLRPLVSAPPLLCPADSAGPAAGRTVTSYEYKVWLARGHAQSDIARPAGMALAWEQWAYHLDGGHLSEYDRRAAMNIVFADGHAQWKRLGDASTARYGLGPDLHGLFREDLPLDPLSGEDFAPPRSP